MSSQSHLRLVVLHVLVISLMVTLAGRLWYLQILSGERYSRAAQQTRTQEVATPALRGTIYDASGRALATNRGDLVVTVSRSELAAQPDDGTAVLRRLARQLPGLSYAQIRQRIRLCSAGHDQPCWSGSPYQPIPVTDEVDRRTALTILEREAAFPGVSARVRPMRSYPRPQGVNAAHILGHLGPITEAELQARQGQEKQLTSAALVGKGGLEETYEKQLRGTPGTKTVTVDSQGRVTGTKSVSPSVPGNDLVTSIDADVQRVVEKAIRDALQDARAGGKPADAAAGVVMDVRSGRILGMASRPTFDPEAWVGGISQSKYERLTSEKAGNPLVSRAIQGQFPAGSTFKPFAAAGAVEAGFPLYGTYSCPSSYQVGSRSFRNYGGLSYGPVDLHRALVVSCDTVFYRLGHQLWQRQQKQQDSTEPIPHMAKQFGLGSSTGADLPSESEGRIPDPEWKRAYWKQRKDDYCEHARTGYPDVAEDNPARARYLTELAKSQCQAGFVWRPGDAVNLAIGQGDMLTTPLQLTRAYAAIANGGTVYSPRIGKAVLAPDGSVAERIDPPVVRRVPVDDRVLAYIRDALADVPRKGTAASAFAGFPLDKVPVAGKTGTAEARGEEDTAWFASFAPADEPQYAVVVMVSQGGLGSRAAAPAVRQIYEGMYGLGGGNPALPDGGPPSRLPEVSEPRASTSRSFPSAQDAGPAPANAAPAAAGGSP